MRTFKAINMRSCDVEKY